MKKLSLTEINEKAIKVVKSIKLLDEISWPPSLEEEFFKALKKGKGKLPKLSYEKKDYTEKKEALNSLLPLLSKDDPRHIFTAKTIQSYLSSLDLMENVGNSAFQEISIKEYGHPRHLLFGSKYSHLKTAEHFIDAFHEYDHPYVVDDYNKYSASELQKYLKEESIKALGEHAPKIEISKNLTSKVAAGKTKVRIRKNAKFSENDFKNLLVHEVLTHTLTGINGSLQDSLPLLGFGAPRTTKTQEGLATFSEVINGTLDLDRLKRISLRVTAIDMALKGADLYDLFEFFKSKGQDDKESYLSASRILRGGFPQGGIVFTKDGVYLEGLIRVHSFFRWAFRTENLELIHLLMVGRLDLNDVFLLKESYQQGLISHPRYLPTWYSNFKLLAGKMAFSLILNDICLQSVEHHFEGKLSNLKAS
jgi:uncharacterized protein (TIGR02421 family)